MSEYDPLRSYMHNWFLGVHVKQFFIEFLAWEKFFLRIAYLRRIIELGAGQGGFSFYLFLQAKKRMATFDTWDIAPIHMAATKFGNEMGFGECCHSGDLLKDEKVIEEISQLISNPGKTLLFCDNGNKAREVQLYVPYLKVGDYMAVHDWGHEIFPKNIEDLPLKPYEVEHVEELGCWTRFFEVTDELH